MALGVYSESIIMCNSTSYQLVSAIDLSRKKFEVDIRYLKNVELPDNDVSHGFHFAIGAYRVYRGNLCREEPLADSGKYTCFSLPMFKAIYIQLPTPGILLSEMPLNVPPEYWFKVYSFESVTKVEPIISGNRRFYP